MPNTPRGTSERAKGQKLIEKAGRVCQKLEGSKVNTKTAIISIVDLNSEAIGTLGNLLKAIPGVESVDFSIERKVAVAEFDPTQTHVDELLRAVLKAGFRVS